MQKTDNSNETTALTLRLRPYLITLFLAWTLVIVLSFISEVYQHRSNAEEVAKLENMATYNKDLAYRRWGARHGGVYAPITKESPANPYLSHIKERDITTPSGRKLTLINPAYMTRQVFDLSKEQYGIHAHITSLKPINPNNVADPWETDALKRFESGAKNVVRISEINGESYMRLMMPMVTEEPCLKCHEKQGYKVGDIRGGISVSTPLASHYKIAQESSYTAAIQHFVLWLIGVLGLSFGGKRFKKQLDKQRETEQDLQKSERRLKEAQRMAKVGNWELNLKDNRLYWSDEIYNIFDMDPETFEPSYETFLSTIHPDDREMVNKVYWTAVKEHVPYEITHRILTKGGVVKYVYEQSQEITDETGEAIRSVGTVQDVTQVKLAEQALQDSEERFRAIFEEAADSILLIDAETAEFTEFNDQAHKSLGYTREEFTKMTLRDVEVKESTEDIEEHFAKIIHEGRDSFETKHINKAGEKRDIMVRVKSVEVKGKQYLVAIFRDITERKQMLEELQELNKNLEQRVAEEVENSREKDQIMFEQSRHIAMAELLVNLAHQWRQPICAIGTIAQDIEDAFHYNELDEKYLKDSVKMITNEVNDLSETINEFRTFFTKESQSSEFSVKESIAKALRMTEEAVRLQNATIQLEGIEDAKVIGYANEFSQAIHNIVKNSLEVSEELGMSDCKVTIAISRMEKNKTCIEITDNCGGIDAKVLVRIFDPYYTTRVKTRGKGIGLFMSKTIIENNLRGSLRVENVPNGTRFIIEV